MVKAIRDEVKKNIADLKKFLFQISVENTLSDMASCQESVEELVSLTLTFKKMLDQLQVNPNLMTAVVIYDIRVIFFHKNLWSCQTKLIDALFDIPYHKTIITQSLWRSWYPLH